MARDYNFIDRAEVPLARDEQARLYSLHELCLLDTPPEPAYDGLVALAAQLAGTPAAVLTLVDAERQWFKARLGLSLVQTDRADSFCTHTVEGSDVFVVEDARQDTRFAGNPLVTGAPGIGFYAGAPLTLPDGQRVGAIAVMDWAPREAGAELLVGLKRLADQAVALFELRRERQRHADTAMRLTQAQTVARVGSWELDLTTRQLIWSDEVYRIFGVEPRAFAATFEAFLSFVHPDDRAGLVDAQGPVEAGRATLDFCHRIVRADGTLRHVRERAQRVAKNNGDGALLVGAVLDVTEEIAARLAAEAGRVQVAMTLDSLRLANQLGRLGGWDYELATGQLRVDAEVGAIFGYPPGVSPSLDQAFGHVHRDDREALRTAFDACRVDGKPYDQALRIRDLQGIEHWARAFGQAQREADGRIVFVRGAFQDITEQTRQAEELGRLGQRLVHTLERMGDAFYLLDACWCFQYFNRAAESALGRKRAEVLGCSIWESFTDMVGTPLEAHYRGALARQRAARFDYHWEAGKRWFDVHVFPTEDGLAVHFRDVTDARQLSERLRESQKLESLGQLTGGVAHDFNNILTVIQGNAEVLTETMPVGARAHTLAAMIFTAAQRGAELTQRLLAFARRQALEPRVLDLNRLVDGMVPLLQRTLGEPVAIDVVRGAGLWQALVDPGQLENALLNLAINARDAMPAGGQLRIETANAQLDAEDVRGHADLSPGAFVMLAVSDTGSGIAPGDISRVFEPFFTTKEPGKGTGLGLAMVYGLVKQSGGHVTLHSQPGLGTTVRLYLPRGVGTPAASPENAVAEGFDGGQRLVLVVEDEPLVREFAAGLMRQLGFRVVEAGHAAEALQVLRTQPDVALLFTDVVMPGGMSGRELAEQAQTLHPGLPVLYTSGYTENAIVHHGRLDAGVVLLGKPYRRTELARKLREVLAPAEN